MTKCVKHCYLALFQSIYSHFWQEKYKTKSKLLYQKMPWIKDLQRKVWISSKFGFVEKSKLLDFSTMLVFWSLVSLVRNSLVLAVYLLFSVSCFFTVHEHWPQGYHCHNLPAGWWRPRFQGRLPVRSRGSAKRRLRCWKIPYFNLAGIALWLVLVHRHTKAGQQNRPAFWAARFRLSSFFIFCWAVRFVRQWPQPRQVSGTLAGR